MIYITEINLSVIFKIDSEPIETMCMWQKLESSSPNGDVSAPARISDLILTLDAAKQRLTMSSLWIASIISIQKMTTTDRPDLPVELNMATTATGIDYKIQMETLDQIITWNRNQQELTIHAAQASNISFEAFMYYIDTLSDLIKAIDQL